MGDFNRDGVQDLATANDGSNDVSVLYSTNADSGGGVVPDGREMVTGDGGCQARSRLVLPRLDDADDAAATDDLPRESGHGKDEGHLDPGVDFHDLIGEEEDT